MTATATGLVLALVAAGAVLVAIGAVWEHLNGNHREHDHDAERRRVRRELDHYDQRGRRTL